MTAGLAEEVFGWQAGASVWPSFFSSDSSSVAVRFGGSVGESRRADENSKLDLNCCSSSELDVKSYWTTCTKGKTGSMLQTMETMLYCKRWHMQELSCEKLGRVKQTC